MSSQAQHVTALLLPTCMRPQSCPVSSCQACTISPRSWPPRAMVTLATLAVMEEGRSTPEITRTMGEVMSIVLAVPAGHTCRRRRVTDRQPRTTTLQLCCFWQLGTSLHTPSAANLQGGLWQRPSSSTPIHQGRPPECPPARARATCRPARAGSRSKGSMGSTRRTHGAQVGGLHKLPPRRPLLEAHKRAAAARRPHPAQRRRNRSHCAVVRRLLEVFIIHLPGNEVRLTLKVTLAVVVAGRREQPPWWVYRHKK